MNTTVSDKSGLYSIRDRLSMMDGVLQEDSHCIETMIGGTQQLLEELTDLSKRTSNTTNYIVKDVTSDCQEKQEYIQRHMSQQKAENLRMASELSEISATNADFRNSLQECENKLLELKARIGVDVELD